MKIIHHPKSLEELSRKIEIEKFNLEVSQRILREKHKAVDELRKKIYVISFSMFSVGFVTGVVLMLAIRDFL